MQKKTLLSIIGLAALFLTCDWFWISQYFLGKVSTSTHCATLVKEEFSITIMKNKSLASDCFTRQHFLSRNSLEQSLMFGTPPSPKKYLLIGIPTISRKKKNYLHQTLKSLIKNMNSTETSNVAIVVLFADVDPDLRYKRAKKVLKRFSESIKSGLLILSETFPEIYPKSNITQRTFSDSLERIKWRSKQVLDWAFLLAYSQNLSEYFLLLEDDVITIPGFVTTIQDFVQEKKDSDWVSLTFSSFSIIGRLLKSADLKRLTEFLLLFYLEKPVDFLISQFVDILVPNPKIVSRRIPGLFQHIGLYSSLDGKIQILKDGTVPGTQRGFHFENVTAMPI